MLSQVSVWTDQGQQKVLVQIEITAKTGHVDD